MTYGKIKHQIFPMCFSKVMRTVTRNIKFLCDLKGNFKNALRLKFKSASKFSMY